jgi:hypothetical protein
LLSIHARAVRRTDDTPEQKPTTTTREVKEILAMRFLMYRFDDESAPIQQLTREQMAEMRTVTEEATKAGVLVFNGGIAPSATGSKVTRTDGEFTVTDGPFTEAKELVGGWALVETRDKDEAIEWSKRLLNVAGDGEMRIRQVW